MQLFHQRGTIENTEIPGQWQRMTLLGKSLLQRRHTFCQDEGCVHVQQHRSGKGQRDTLQQEMNQERQARQEQSSAQIAANGQRDAVASLWRVNDAL